MCFSAEVAKKVERILKKFACNPDHSEHERINELISKGNDPYWVKEFLSLKQKPKSNPFKMPDKDNRIYPGYFAPVIVSKNLERVSMPMRYRVRPQSSKEEIPSKFNV